ncbi:MAG: adenylate/guanylate cyclase domain-containing protein [Treponema sp.]|nr:adenylate/guanylate cyclase domain-containing protein [Treponema sp.]
MSERLRYGIKNPLFSIAILAVSGAAAFLLSISGLTHYWDTNLYDYCINTRVVSTDKSRSPIVATIDLNDRSIEALGEDLDTRRSFADLVNVLNDSNTSVNFDFLFTSVKSHDDDFTSAVEWSGAAVVASLAVRENIFDQPNRPYRELNEREKELFARHVWHINVVNEGKIPVAGTFILPVPSLIESATQIAHINVEPDEDGIYRRANLLYKWGDGYIPSLPLAAGVLYWGIPVESIILKAGEYLAVPLAEDEIIKIPIDEYGRVLIPYSENWVDQQNRISFDNVVKARYDDDAFDEVFSTLTGKIAIVAEISTSQKDFGPTSFESLYPLSGIHVEVLSGFLDWSIDRAFIGTNASSYKLIVISLILIAAFIFINIKGELFSHLGFVSAVAFLTSAALYRWLQWAIAPWFAFPAILLLLLWAGSFLSRLFIRYRAQLLMQNALSRYFPRALAERIMKEGKTDLKPGYKDLTILFSDISGFTKWSSDKKPEDVHGFLNEYLENMANILFAHGGTVDKFMGDGILAFFGDPFEMEDHTERSIEAAIAMQKEVRILAEKWKPLVNIDLKVRIGINTGKVIVGNLGSKTRVEYTVIGAAVNLAQRMESNAPVGGILVTSHIWEKVKDKFNFTEKKNVSVKGYEEIIEAYVVDQGIK